MTKQNKIVSIALDYKALNKAIHENKYLMQNIDHLMDSLAAFIFERTNPFQRTFCFSKTDILSAYSQVIWTIMFPNIATLTS